MSFVCHSYFLVYHSYITRRYSYVILMSLVCHPYGTRMYLYFIPMSLVCTHISFVCHSYVLVCHPYVTRMYSYVIRMSLVCGFTMNRSSVCYFTFTGKMKLILFLYRYFSSFLISFFASSYFAELLSEAY